MPVTCTMPACRALVPAELESERLCVAHFALAVEDACSDLRRETADTNLSAERRAEIAGYIAGRGELLIQVATSGLRVADDTKMRILSTFLALINLRESLDRRSQPRPAGRQSSA